MFTALRPGIIKILLLTVQVFSSAPVLEQNDSGLGSNDTDIIGRQSSDDIIPTNEIIQPIIGLVVIILIVCCCFWYNTSSTKSEVTVTIQTTDESSLPETFHHDGFDYQTVADLSHRYSIAFAVKAES